jgi:6-phosphogluconolactonase (cycloisomerase 2 family)
VVVLSIDKWSGRLRPTASRAHSDHPMCVKCLMETP